MKKIIVIMFFAFGPCGFSYSQAIWRPVVDVCSNSYIDGGAVRVLHQEGNALMIGGEFDTLKSNATILVPPFLSWYVNCFDWPDCAPWIDYQSPSNSDPNPVVNPSVWSIASVFDSSMQTIEDGAGGRFTTMWCSNPFQSTYGNDKNLQFYDLYSGYLVTDWMTCMDTVFALAMADNKNPVSCAYPNFKTYVGAKQSLCACNDPDCDTNSYIAMYDPWLGCLHIDSINYMQGGTNGPVYSIFAVDTSEVYAGGKFTSAGLISTNNIAKWEGISWDSLGSGVNGIVKAILKFNNKLYVGGSFTMAGGVPANNIAVWDGIQWSALGAGTNDTVYALAVYNGNLYVGGAFTMAGNTIVNHIAKWNAFQWYALNGGRNQTVYAVAAYLGDIYAGGKFTGGTADTAKYLSRYTDTITGGLSMNEYVNSFSVLLYPNPFRSSTTLEIKNYEDPDFDLDVYDITGRRVSGIKELRTTKFIFEKGDLKNGIYFYSIRDRNSKGVIAKGKLIISD